MYIGTAIAMIAIGLILALAVDDMVPGVNLQMVGWILTLVGIVGAVLALTIWSPSRRTTGTREVVRERDHY
ncbi:MAG TPA: DUF6458 family protein [Egibacteraceae bacterium]|nr:DUF6458 family protein [Egibacteraceae bacterium]